MLLINAPSRSYRLDSVRKVYFGQFKYVTGELATRSPPRGERPLVALPDERPEEAAAV